MLTTARPIFEHVPGSFCDPVGLADQQAQGVVALVVVRYPTTDDPPPAEQRANENSPPAAERIGGVAEGGGGSVLGPTYDAFVAVSGQLLTVARSTPDYRFPVMPAAALARFIEHRDAGRPVFLSLYQLDEDDCARFLETVFYAECLKLHVEGADSAPLVAQQIARSACANGILEVNDFSDPTAPRLHLMDLSPTGSSLAPASSSTGALPPRSRKRGSTAQRGGGQGASPQEKGALPDLLRPYLDGISGRVLLYDRVKNKATLPDRAGRPFNLDAALEQADRLAEARRGVDRDAALPAEALDRAASELQASAPDDQAEAVEAYLRDRADRPRLVEPDHPHASGLGALVAELQGRGTARRPAIPDPYPTPGEPPPALNTPSTPEPAATESTAPVEQSADVSSPPFQGGVPAAGRGGGPSSPSTPSPPPSPGPAPVHRHPLATELDRLRCDVVALFEEAVSKDRAAAHEAHVLAQHGLPLPVPPDRTPAYLRALLTDDPPRRWHFFKRQRGKTYEEVAGKLLAFHAAHSHSDDPEALRALHEITKLWTRLHK